MPPSQFPTHRPNIAAMHDAERKSNNELLFKGVLCALIGAGVLVSPYFVGSPDVQIMVGKASLVGWFAVFLGLAFMGGYGWRRLAVQE